MMMLKIENEQTLRALILANIASIVSGVVIVVWLFSGFSHTQNQILSDVQRVDTEQRSQWERISNLERNDEIIIEEIIELQELHPRHDGDDPTSARSASSSVAGTWSSPRD